MIPEGDAATRCRIAAVLLFTTQPSDRALAGWCAADWVDEELVLLRAAAGGGL